MTPTKPTTASVDQRKVRPEVDVSLPADTSPTGGEILSEDAGRILLEDGSSIAIETGAK